MSQNKPTIEEIEDAIPEERKHMNGLVDAMEQADIDSHKRGNHEAKHYEDCPLCVEENE